EWGMGGGTVSAMGSVVRACQGLPIRGFEAGDAVIAEGSPAEVLYVLASGSVEVVKGDVQITTVAEPGSFLGEMSVLLARPHTATVRALAPSAGPHPVPEVSGFLSRLLGTVCRPRAAVAAPHPSKCLHNAAQPARYSTMHGDSARATAPSCRRRASSVVKRAVRS